MSQTLGSLNDNLMRSFTLSPTGEIVQKVLNLGGGAPLARLNYDYGSYTSGATTDTYVFKTGGSGGTTVATLTITYTDSTKVQISTWAWT